MKLSRGPLVLALALTAGLLAACDSTTSSPGASQQGDQANAGKLAVIVPSLGDEYWQGVKKGAEETGEALGVDIDVFAIGRKDDVEGQARLLEEAIVKGYGAIAFSPVSPTGLNESLARATKAGIYLVSVEEMVDGESLGALGGAVQGHLATNHFAFGAIAANHIIEKVGKVGDVAIIEGGDDAAVGAERRDGAESLFADAGLRIVKGEGGDRAGARALARDYLEAHPDLLAIYAVDDSLAMGALEAVRASRRDVIVVGTGGSDEAIASIKAGALDATVAKDPATLGGEVVKMLKAFVDSSSPIDLAKKPHEVTIDGALVTATS